MKVPPARLMNKMLIRSLIPLIRMPSTVPMGVDKAKMKANWMIFECAIPLFCMDMVMDMASANLWIRIDRLRLKRDFLF